MTIKLQGGLGNQMFQAAYGLSKGCKEFDVSSFDHDTLRHYELDAYDLDIELVRDTSAEAGYWQSEKYFDPTVALKMLASIKGIPNDKCSEMAKRIIYSKDPCFIGIRRADYLWPERINYHGVMPFSYYWKAMERMPDGNFFVFTDDLSWAKSHFTFEDAEDINVSDRCEIVDVNGPTEKAWDIWLMSLCDNAIIANSSFHFWGAYAGPDRNGKVIAPAAWYADAKMNEACETVPERWTKL